MDLSGNRVIKYGRLLLIIALYIWGRFSIDNNIEYLYGGCLFPLRLNSNIVILYLVITMISVVLAFFIRNSRIAFYILLFELLLWSFHFLAFRGWPNMTNQPEGSTAYSYFYKTALYDYIGFFIRILLITSFSWYKKLSLFFIQLVVLLGIAGYLVIMKMNPNEFILTMRRPIIEFHIHIFEFLGFNVV